MGGNTIALIFQGQTSHFAVSCQLCFHAAVGCREFYGIGKQVIYRPFQTFPIYQGKDRGFGAGEANAHAGTFQRALRFRKNFLQETAQLCVLKLRTFQCGIAFCIRHIADQTHELKQRPGHLRCLLFLLVLCQFWKQTVSQSHHIGKGRSQLLRSQSQCLQLCLISIPIHKENITIFLPYHRCAAADPSDLHG